MVHLAALEMMLESGFQVDWKPVLPCVQLQYLFWSIRLYKRVRHLTWRVSDDNSVCHLVQR